MSFKEIVGNFRLLFTNLLIVSFSFENFFSSTKFPYYEVFKVLAGILPRRPASGRTFNILAHCLDVVNNFFHFFTSFSSVARRLL